MIQCNGIRVKVQIQLINVLRKVLKRIQRNMKLSKKIVFKLKVKENVAFAIPLFEVYLQQL